MATSKEDLENIRPDDTVAVRDLPQIARTIIDYLLDSISSTSGSVQQCPVGSMVNFAGASVPTGWLVCDGSTVNETSYPELYLAIGTTWGGTGGSDFRLPDLRRRYALGSGGSKQWTAQGDQDSDYEVGVTLGSTGGEEKHNLIEEELPVITPVTYSIDAESAPHGVDATESINVAKGVGKTASAAKLRSIGGGLSLNLLPPSAVVNVIIKAKS